MYKIVLTALIAAFCAPSVFANTSRITSLREKDCFQISVYKRMNIVTKQSYPFHSESSCPGVDGNRVYVILGDDRTWLKLEKNGVSSDFQSAVFENAPGFFPNVGDELEWRFDDRGQLKALIFQVNAQDTSDAYAQRAALFVVRAQEDGRFTYIGKSDSLDGARELADAP